MIVLIGYVCGWLLALWYLTLLRRGGLPPLPPVHQGKSPRANAIDGYVRARGWTYPLTPEQRQTLDERFPGKCQ